MQVKYTKKLKLKHMHLAVFFSFVSPTITSVLIMQDILLVRRAVGDTDILPLCRHFPNICSGTRGVLNKFNVFTIQM